MNELVSKFADKLVVLGFPCNQFGHQENANGTEIVQSLCHVRPGNGFRASFPIMEKVSVNGEKTHPVFNFLKERLPTPSDDPVSLMTNPQLITWSPVKRNDISWNFEKFLVAPDGKPYMRYSRNFQTIHIQNDIKELLAKCS